LIRETWPMQASRRVIVLPSCPSPSGVTKQSRSYPKAEVATNIQQPSGEARGAGV
jgi:hypothetical protein